MLAAQRQSTDSSARTDVKLIWYQLEAGNADWVYWTPGRLSLADPENNTIVSRLRTTTFAIYCKIPFGLSEFGETDAEEKSFAQSRSIIG